jgi:arsenical pump membrane protein
MYPLFVCLMFLLTVLSIFVNQRVIRRFRFLDMPYYLAPLIFGLITLALGAMSPEDVYRSLTGYNFSAGFLFLSHSGPFSIAVLFLSVTFIAIALDVSGFFEYLAVQVLKHVQTSGKKIFISIYLMTSILTLFTSNDILILTLTPFLLVFLRHLRVDPIPFLIAEFFAANILSMGMLVGNPTNIIVGTYYNISFVDYMRVMLLPAFVAGTVTLLLLYDIFKKDIDIHCRAEKLPAVYLNLWSVLALFLLGSALFSITLRYSAVAHRAVLGSCNYCRVLPAATRSDATHREKIQPVIHLQNKQEDALGNSAVYFRLLRSY